VERDALHFSKLVDRFVQNLRRFVGYDVQYFARVEPQKRFAPHLHMAIRDTISRQELRQVVAATYHQVWWPSTNTVIYDGTHLPIWDDQADGYVDPNTGEALPTWDEALDELEQDETAEPLHLVRFGRQIDAQGATVAGQPLAKQAAVLLLDGHARGRSNRGGCSALARGQSAGNGPGEVQSFRRRTITLRVSIVGDLWPGAVTREG